MREIELWRWRLRAQRGKLITTRYAMTEADALKREPRRLGAGDDGARGGPLGGVMLHLVDPAGSHGHRYRRLPAPPDPDTGRVRAPGFSGCGSRLLYHRRRTMSARVKRAGEKSRLGSRFPGRPATVVARVGGAIRS